MQSMKLIWKKKKKERQRERVINYFAVFLREMKNFGGDFVADGLGDGFAVDDRRLFLLHLRRHRS